MGNQTFKANTLKLSVSVQNWPFYSLTNTLGIVFDGSAQGSSDSGCVVSDSSYDTVQWVLVVVDDFTLYHTSLSFFFLTSFFIFFIFYFFDIVKYMANLWIRRL
jgi:hypothetical protein